MSDQRPVSDDGVLPQPTGAAESEGAEEPLTARPAQRLLGGVAMAWFGVALVACVLLFVVWSIFR